MTFQFDKDDPGVEAGFRRVAAEQLDDALRALAEAGTGEAEAVHAVRKSCKRLRGLLRLVRSGFKDYAEENAAVRDAAGLLSASRDAAVLDATLAAIASRLAPEIADDLRAALGAREAPTSATGDAEALLRCHAALARIRGRVNAWTLKRDGFAALEEGFGATYKRARTDMARAAAKPSTDGFHDWRKAVKYHFHHLDLLSAAAPHMLKSQRKLADRLAETLGEHHDAAVFEQIMEREPDAFRDVRDRDAVRDALRARQEALAAEAASLGRELLAERPRNLRGRMRRYWRGRSVGGSGHGFDRDGA